MRGRQRRTTYTYDSNPFVDTCTATTPSSSFLTNIAYPSTNGVAHTENFTYNCASGDLATSTDENGNTTTYQYHDNLNRLTETSYPDGGQTTIVYNDAVPSVTTSKLLSTSGTESNVTTMDGMGHVIQTELTSDPGGADIVTTTYDGAGRVYTMTNPYRAGSSSIGMTEHYYDALGRQIEETEQDGSILQWCYEGIPSFPAVANCSGHIGSVSPGTWVDSSDEAGNHWQRTSDSFGRLTEVVEPNGTTHTPTMETDYSYDALNDLRSVTQWGGASGSSDARARSFIYDSLSRLTSATNPETGTIGYGYDANSNLTSKTDARGITTSYTYDALNRLTQKSYSDGVTSEILYGYDLSSIGFVPVPSAPSRNLTASLKNTIGRLAFASSTNSGSLDAYSYDAMGRVVNQWVSTPSYNTGASPVFPVSAKYDLAGDMTDLTYPDGRHIQQVWNGAREVTSSTLADIGGVVQSPSQSYLASASYYPDGSPSALAFGNGVQQTIGENNRLQVQSLAVSSAAAGFGGGPFLSHSYCYTGCTTGGTANNGNIWGITDTLKAANTQGFTYDSLNRISSFSLGGAVSQQYSIDSFGNMSAVSGGAAVTTFNPSTNRVSNLPCASSITPFDAAGNQLCDTDSNGVVRQYGLDAESHTTQIAILGNTADPFETYTYDAGGSRSRKTNGTGTYTEYINFGGQTVAENNGDGTMSDYIFANGQRIARADDFDVRIHMSGTNCSGCSSTNTFAGTQSLTAANGMVIQNGDLLAWRQYQDGVAAGGISIGLGNGTTGTAGVLRAEDGQLTDDDTRTGSWYMRVANLNAYAGMTISSLNLYNNQGGAPGNWDIYLGDIVLVHANGTIVPLYDRTLSGLSPFSPGAAETNVSVITEDVLNSSKPATTSDITTTTYYVGDHLGSEQLLTGGGGWPLSSSQYMPFGAEIVPTSNPNHYKFTGKERDTESGNDYFGARYYASTMGRFMSPDWAAKAEPVPYSKLDDPQTLNLYSYVRNNPLSGVDPDGHYFVVSAAMQQQVQQYISTLLRTPQGAATVNAIASSNLPVSFGLGTLPAVSNGNGTMSITAGTTVPVPGSTPGAIGGASVTLDNANISTIANATGKSDFQTGLTAFTHEDQHVTDILGAKTLQGAAAAGAAGDAPSAPGANNTTGGTAEGRAQQIVGALGAAGQSFQPNAQYDGAAANILKQGAAQQQAAQQKAACTGGSCPQ